MLQPPRAEEAQASLRSKAVRERSTTTVAILGAGTREAIGASARRAPTNIETLPAGYEKHRWRSPSGLHRSEAL
jgi:hypothetical protein